MTNFDSILMWWKATEVASGGNEEDYNDVQCISYDDALETVEDENQLYDAYLNSEVEIFYKEEGGNLVELASVSYLHSRQYEFMTEHPNKSNCFFVIILP